MLQVKNLTKVHGEGASRVTALNDVSFEVNPGDFIAITGPSGSGKSTLLNILGSLERVTEGEVILDGARIDNISEDALVNIRRHKIGYIFQQYHLLPSLTALENVLLPLAFSGANHAESRAFELLRLVGLGDRVRHKPSQLSGGEQQRVAIARAMISNPVLTLADEPTGNLDQRTGKGILDLFCQLNDEGRSIVIVTHNPEAAERAKEVIALEDGRIVNRVKNR